jgi:hypothetical protein
MPAYSSKLRIKQCPKCSQLIELRKACNHMTCSQYKHQFCFVCLLAWNGIHNEASSQVHEVRTLSTPRVGGGCPVSRDPICGYDAEGLEPNERGSNVYTGLDRNGCDRIKNQRRADEEYADLFGESSTQQPQSQAERQNSQRETLADMPAWLQGHIANTETEREARQARRHVRFSDESRRLPGAAAQRERLVGELQTGPATVVPGEDEVAEDLTAEEIERLRPQNAPNSAFDMAMPAELPAAHMAKL